jgi:Transposase DDE domain
VALRLRERRPDRLRGFLRGFWCRSGTFGAGWKSARWVDAGGRPLDLIAEFRKAAARGLIDRSIWIKCKRVAPLILRLVAVKKPPEAAAEARRKARRAAQREGHTISKQTLEAADWVILVTSLTPETFTAEDVLALYRLRWRIELGFKRLKSLIGLKAPPGIDERSARPYLLAHLLMILLLEPLIRELEDPPPTGPRPPDHARHLAPPAPTDRFLGASDHPPAHDPTPTALQTKTPATSA